MICCGRSTELELQKAKAEVNRLWLLLSFFSVFPITTRCNLIELPECIGKVFGRRVAQFVRYLSNAFVAFAQKQAGSRHAGFCSFLEKCFVVMLLKKAFCLAFAQVYLMSKTVKGQVAIVVEEGFFDNQVGQVVLVRSYRKAES